MFFEIWKRINKKKLEKLNKIAPYIEPTDQSKKIAKYIAENIKIEESKIHIGKVDR